MRRLLPFGEPVVEHRPVEDDLLLGRERGGGQDARTQLRGRNRRGAALADHHGGGRVGRAHGRLIVDLGCEHRRQGGDHGIARTRRIPHLDRIGGHPHRRAVRRYQGQAGVAERHHDRLGFQADGSIPTLPQPPLHRSPSRRRVASESSLRFGLITVAPR